MGSRPVHACTHSKTPSTSPATARAPATAWSGRDPRSPSTTDDGEAPLGHLPSFRNGWDGAGSLKKTTKRHDEDDSSCGFARTSGTIRHSMGGRTTRREGGTISRYYTPMGTQTETPPDVVFGGAGTSRSEWSPDGGGPGGIVLHTKTAGDWRLRAPP